MKSIPPQIKVSMSWGDCYGETYLLHNPKRQKTVAFFLALTTARKLSSNELREFPQSHHFFPAVTQFLLLFIIDF